MKDMVNGTRRYASESTLILCVDLALDCDLNIRLGLDVEPSWLDTSCREMNGCQWYDCIGLSGEARYPRSAPNAVFTPGPLRTTIASAKWLRIP